jgi:di/tricarboxylate transporter
MAVLAAATTLAATGSTTGVPAATVFGLPTGMLVVFALVVAAVVLFVTEAVSPDVTALGLLVTLAVLGPWTGISPTEALAGFSNPATMTILAMYVLSRGIGNTGLVRRLGAEVANVTRGSESRLLAAIVVLTGPIAGVVNNTPVVAVFIPMVTDLAEEAGVSPSKLLLPLSYASMLGGTLTLIGTAGNLIASDVARERLGAPFTMFEFTALGVVVLVVGSAYLLVVAPRLIPARVSPGDRTARYEVEAYLARVLVPSRSPLVGATASEVVADAARDLDIDVLDIVRGDDHFLASGREIESRDILTVRGNPETIQQFVELADLRLLPRASVTDAELDPEGKRPTLVEVVVPTNSDLVNETVAASRLRERYDATILAIRPAGGDLVREGFSDVTLEAGDSLLLQTTPESAAFLVEARDLVATGELVDDLIADIRSRGLAPTTVPALLIVFGVVALAALDVLPIVVAALGGVVAMIVTGCLTTSEAYDAVNWSVIFLLAGILPLGRALQETGGVDLLAGVVVSAASLLPVLAVVAVFYLLTGLLANIITPVASIVLLAPVAITTAQGIGASGFAFLLAVTFGGSTAFMTPVGYQTNLMVYGPGGYRFTDYVRVGGPLQLLLTVVTTLGIWLLYGLDAPV